MKKLKIGIIALTLLISNSVIPTKRPVNIAIQKSTIQCCPICQGNPSDHKNKEKVSPYSCDHQFFKECIEGWEGNCPICRAQIDISKTEHHTQKIKIPGEDEIIVSYNSDHQIICIDDDYYDIEEFQ